MSTSPSFISIHTAAPDLADKLADMHALCFGEGWKAEALAGYIDCQTDTVLTAQSDVTGELAGFLIYRLIVEEAEIITFCVAPEWRRQGVGAALCGEAIFRLKKKSARTIFLEVKENNIAARKLYEQYGFKLVAMRKDYYRTSDAKKRLDAFVLQLHL